MSLESLRRMAAYNKTLDDAADAQHAEVERARAKRQAASKRPILCLDFDGVVHSYTSRWQGADVIPDPPVDGAIAFMLGALHCFDVVIFSSRSNQKGGIDAMRKWLKEHAGSTWYESPAGPGLEDVRFVKEKPPAMVTLDDRAITFTGTWPALADLRAFKPWNKP